MQHRRRVLIRCAAYPLFDDRNGLLDRLVSDREVIPVVRIRGSIAVLLEEILNEFISGQTVDSNGAVAGNDYDVVRLVKFVSLRSDKFFQNVGSGLESGEFDQTGIV